MNKITEGKISEKNNSENKGEIFELEEADVPLPPLYLLKDEGSEKWVLLSDLCNILKVKSKETLMKQVIKIGFSITLFVY